MSGLGDPTDPTYERGSSAYVWCIDREPTREESVLAPLLLVRGTATGSEEADEEEGSRGSRCSEDMRQAQLQTEDRMETQK